jgi:DUF438 domain-containing protein
MTELIDNRAHRIRTLKHVIRQLHEGEGVTPDHVKRQLKELVQQTDAGEIGAMEQELIAEGMPVEEIRSMCDLHAEVLREITVEPARPEIPPGHPVDTFRRENEAIGKAAAAMRATIAEIRQRPEGDKFDAALHRWQQAYNELTDVDKHYQRKENVLFPRLEEHGITGPSKVMWAKDDTARQLLKLVGRGLAKEDVSLDELIELADSAAEPALEEIEGMIFKEEDILLPMALGTLTEEEWGGIWRHSPEFGWCLVEPREGYQPPEPAEPPPAAEVPVDRGLAFSAGTLTVDQLRAIFSVIPVDLTFVDADDRVRFFSEGPNRVFARSKAILGRKVENCHPPKSVHFVRAILDDFRSGRQDKAEFWINFRGRFVHIRYFAVRDPQGKYLGCLEVTQDLTPLRALEGERRLLEYDTPPQPAGTGS